MSGSRAVQRSIVDFFLLKKTTGFPLARKKNLKSTPQRSIAPSVFKNASASGIEPISDQDVR
jgi:hypothetical protein